MKRAPFALGVWAVVVLGTPAPGGADDVRDLDRFFPGYRSALVLLDAKAGIATRHNPAMCRERFSPCSTFKIPNSLIGLETGVIKDAGFVLPWDGVKRGREVANRDHSLTSALQNSIVWYYQELARRVGPEGEKKYVTAMRYGNEDTSAGVDQFWLGTSLRISPDEQAAFLRRFEAGDPPFSPRSIDIVKEILVQPWDPSVVYRGKTGSCNHGEGTKDHGWWVGSVTRGERLWTFAAIIEGEGASGLVARPMVERALVELGVLPLLAGDDPHLARSPGPEAGRVD